MSIHFGQYGACGVPAPRKWTKDPAQVTCRRCKSALWFKAATGQPLPRYAEYMRKQVNEWMQR